MAGCRWLKPLLVGQFEFVEWTADDHLWHSRFIGLRQDKNPTDVLREGGRQTLELLALLRDSQCPEPSSVLRDRTPSRNRPEPLDPVGQHWVALERTHQSVLGLPIDMTMEIPVLKLTFAKSPCSGS